MPFNLECADGRYVIASQDDTVRFIPRQGFDYTTECFIATSISDLGF